MFQLDDGSLALAATDLSNYLACHHLTAQRVGIARGERGRPATWTDPHAELIRDRGEEHEREQLQRLIAESGNAWIDLADQVRYDVTGLTEANERAADAMRRSAFDAFLSMSPNEGNSHRGEEGLPSGFHDWDGSGLMTDEGSEVGFVETPAGLFVGWIDVSWHRGPSTPMPWLRGIVHVPDLEAVELKKELTRARKKRERALRLCRYCDETYLPGHMDRKDVCQGCAEREFGVAH